MSTQYPNGIDNNITLPLAFDNITEVAADTINRIRDGLISVESALGLQPAGTFVSTGGVRARLDNVDTQLVSLNISVADVVVEVNNIISTLTGEGIALGNPVGGFLPGITTLQTTTPITEAVNTFNNIMSYLAPAQPQSMASLAIDVDPATPLSIYSGKISTLTSPPGGASYYGPFTAGATSSRIIRGSSTQVFRLTTHNTNNSTTGFSDADKGILTVFVNGVQVTTFNLGTAFDEAHRADVAGQGITYSGGTGSSTPPLKTIDTHTDIYSIALFSGFPLWQKGVVEIKNTTLSPGYNSFQVKHTVGAVDRLSQIFQLFYDNGALTPTFPSSPTLSIAGSPSSFNYLSGVKFLSSGESLTLSATINNAFVNTYSQTPLDFTFTAGIPSVLSDTLSDPSLQFPPSNNPSAPNAADQLIVANKNFPITVLNQQTINQVATVTYKNIYGTSFTALSPSQNLLINTYNTPASTANSDGFFDENRRLLPDISGATNAAALYPNDYVTLPTTITGQWTASAVLTNGNAQCFNAQLIYPTIDFSPSLLYKPAQSGSANYSGFNNSNAHGGQVYYRAMFSSGNPRSTGTLTISGVSLADITGLSPHVKVEMKLPGPTGTGWLDFSIPFNSGTFTGTTGQGCRTGNSGNVFGWSVGGFTTGNTGFMYILRITLFDTARPISSLSESFLTTF